MSVEINETNFPGGWFRNYVSNYFDTDQDGWLSDEEISAVTVIDFHDDTTGNKGRLQGLEFFTELTTLKTRFASYLDVSFSTLTKLRTIEIGGAYEYNDNTNKEWDFSGCVSLRNLTLNTVMISTITFPSSIEVIDIVCAPQARLVLFPVNVTNCQNLKSIKIEPNSTNMPSPLRGTNNKPYLETVDVPSCYLNGVLDFSGDTALQTLKLSGISSVSTDQQASLNLTGCTSLTELNCTGSYNFTGTLDLSTCSSLTAVYCRYTCFTGLILGEANSRLAKLLIYGPSSKPAVESIDLTTTPILANQFENYTPVTNHDTYYGSVACDYYSYGDADLQSALYCDIRTTVTVSSSDPGTDPSPGTGIEIIAQPEAQNAATGETIVFSVEAQGNNLTYQWQVSHDGSTWSDLAGATESTCSRVASETTNGDQYRCKITDGNGNSVISQAATLTLRSAEDPQANLVITRQPASQTVAAGSSVTFSIEAQGNDLTYRWEYCLPNTQNWIYADGDSSSITIPNVDSDHNGVQYRCIVTDGSGNSLTSGVATITVASSDPGTDPNPGGDDITFKIVRQPKNTTAISGAEATFSVVAQGTDFSYQWQFSSDSGSSWLDVQSDGQFNAYTFTVGDAQNGYLFRCVVTQGTETLTTAAVRLTVRELPSSPERRTYLPSEMADAIRRLGLAGIDLDDIPFGNMPDGLAITTLGSRGATSPEWYEEIAEAINVLKTGIDIEDYQIFKVKTITENGEYAAVEDDCYGFSLVDVDVFGGDSIVDRTVSEPYINDKITTVGAYAFYRCESLPAVDVPNCSTIADGAFMNCTSLSSINAPNCSFVGSSAFQNCIGLSSISLPSCVSVGDYAFDNCHVLSSIALPTCKRIGSWTFRNCTQLVSVDFPLCEMIGNGAFQACGSLASVSLPVCSIIGNDAFNGCSGLLSIELPLCKNIGSSAFRQCNNLAEVSFPECTSIGSFAFYGCLSLSYASFSLCTTIGQSAFCRCSSLSSVSIPSCSEVGGFAFSSCYALSAISLPNCSVIRYFAFNTCQNLSSLYLYGSSVCRLEASNALYGTAIASGNGWIYVPPSLYSAYVSASNWSYYSSRFYYEINVAASMNGMVLELSGAGATLSSNNLSLRDTAVSMSSNQLVFP